MPTTPHCPSPRCRSPAASPPPGRMAFANTNASAFGNITGSYDGVTGALTLTSSGASATVAQFQGGVAGGDLQNTATSPTEGTRTLSVVADDGTTPSNGSDPHGRGRGGGGEPGAELPARHRQGHHARSARGIPGAQRGGPGRRPDPARRRRHGVNSDFGLVRYNADGALDTSFGTGGKVVTPIGTGTDQASSVAVQADGKIVLGGYAYGGSSTYNDFAVARYDADGSLDTSFGNVARSSRRSGAASTRSMAWRFSRTGRSWSADSPIPVSDANYDFALVRYNTDGNLDTSFGSGGKVITPVGSSVDKATGVTIQPDGKILLGGYAITATAIASRWSGTTRMAPSIPASAPAARPSRRRDERRLRQWHGASTGRKILLGGYASGSTGLDFALMRYNADGSLDAGFGTAERSLRRTSRDGSRPKRRASAGRENPARRLRQRAVRTTTSPSRATIPMAASTPASAVAARPSFRSGRHRITARPWRFSRTDQSCSADSPRSTRTPITSAWCG